ncbi:MAG: type II toxin-antitoxin system RelE/ParE family toxin [Paraglaciecola sp.]|nr:type II toxin-antitoxin system RelE/ParE family toxin [Paraglaciecola sp.]
MKILPAAKSGWEKLAEPLRKQFKNKLAQRIENPHVPSAKLKGYDSVYKIKLSNYRSEMLVNKFYT